MSDGFEKYLPTYLKTDIDVLVEGLQTKFTLLDCLWRKVCDSINIVFHDYAIAAEEAAYLRKNGWDWRRRPHEYSGIYPK